jgi:hypothetical protein
MSEAHPTTPQLGVIQMLAMTLFYVLFFGALCSPKG